MAQPNWETIEVPRGAFIGWGNFVGQFVAGIVLDYSPLGGTDTKGNPVPQLTLELIEPAASFNKFGERTDYPAGELVILTCSLVSLKRAVQAAALNPGDLVKITLSNLVQVKTPSGEPGMVKEMDIKVARGAGRARQAATQSAQQTFAPQQSAAPAQQTFAPQQSATPAWPQTQPTAEPPF